MNYKNCRTTLLVSILLFAGTFALFAPALEYNFLTYQDNAFVALNPRVRPGLTSSDLGWAFKFGDAGNWHPLTWMSHMLDCQIFGAHPAGHHFTSILLHALNAVLLFLLLKRTTGALWPSAAVAALFAWHPMRVESVAWISARAEVLSTFLLLLTLCAYVRYVEQWRARATRWGFYAAALALFALALLAQPILAPVPLVLLLLDWWPLQRWNVATATENPETPADPVQPPISILALVLEKIPFFCLGIAAVIVEHLVQQRNPPLTLLSRSPLKAHLLMAINSVYQYITATVWPADLGAIYPMYIHRPKWQILGIIIIFLAVTVFAIHLRKRRPFWMTGWFWFALLILPTTTLFLVAPQSMADRYTYLPSIGLLVLVVWEACDLVEKNAFSQKLLGLVGAAAITACLTASAAQERVWSNDDLVFSHIPMTNVNFTAHAEYADYLMHRNQLTHAEAECAQAVKIYPGYGLLYNLMGTILFREHNYTDSIKVLQLGLKIDPAMAASHMVLAQDYLEAKQSARAEQELIKLCQVQPNNFEAHALLGKVYEEEHRSGEALDEYKQSLHIYGNQPDVLNNAAWLIATSPHAESRNGATAVQLATMANKLTRNSEPVILDTLAASYALAGRYEDAVATVERAEAVATARGLTTMAERDRKLAEHYRARKTYAQP